MNASHPSATAAPWAAPRWLRWIVIAALLSGVAAVASADQPTWFGARQNIIDLFSTKELFGKMGDLLVKFRYAFTTIGCTAVILAATRKVAKARGGEESMGWVATTVTTVALMALAPNLGDDVFEAGDELAAWSKFSGDDAMKTCWDSLLVLLPADSPIGEALKEANDKGQPPKPAEKQDGSWTKLAWTWMKMAWTTMKDALGQISFALQTVANRVLVFLLLLIPALTLFLGMLVIQFGLVVREFLHQGMNIFLPMMIGLLTFDPMRGAAQAFILRFISVALWPVAWALGNAVACSFLVSVMNWAIKLAVTVVATLAQQGGDPPSLEKAQGLLVAACPALPWGLIVIVNVAITITSLMILVSAIAAPIAFTKMITTGACFVGAQLRQAAAAGATIATAALTGGAGIAAAPALAGAAGAAGGAGASFMSSFAMRAASSIGGAAARLAPMAAAGGPAGAAASVGVAALGKAANVVGSLARASNSGLEIVCAEGADGSYSPVGRGGASMLDTLSNANAPLALPESRAAFSVSLDLSSVPRPITPRLFRRTRV